MIRFRLKPLLAIGALLSALTLIAVDFADARPRGSMGSRGSRTFSAPPPTATAPSTARPIERTMTQPSAVNRPGAAATPAGTPARTGFFNRPGFLGGLAAGLLGAGLIGLLFGQGLFSNLAGFASILGFIAQLALIGGVAWLIVRWWNSRSQQTPAYAGPA
jgi:predicted lipid-binding transport protein (Tim44 family)